VRRLRHRTSWCRLGDVRSYIIYIYMYIYIYYMCVFVSLAWRGVLAAP
jgi:hypothetical protein